MNTIKIKENIDTKKQIYRYSLLAMILLTFLIMLSKLIYNKFTDTGLVLLNVLYFAIFAFFAVDFFIKLYKFYKEKGSIGVIDYAKFNISEFVYMPLTLIISILALIMPKNGVLELLQWVFLLKLPSVTKYFNDETVFNVIAKSILCVLIVIFVFPLLNVVAVAFSSPNKVVNLIPNGFTLYSIKYVLTFMPFLKSMLISVFVTVSGTVISVVIMMMSAYPLSKKDMPFKGLMMVFFLIVMLFSGGMAAKIITMNVLHMLDTVWALILPSVINVFHLLLLKGFFEGLPQELEESARLDGANNYRILFQIIVPLSLPMVVTVTMFTAIIYWNNFNNALMYIVSLKELYPIPMFIKDFMSRNPMDVVLENPVLFNHWENVRLSLVLVSIIPIFAVYPFILKYFTKGVTVGAVKG